jgi:hypothetical protein
MRNLTSEAQRRDIPGSAAANGFLDTVEPPSRGKHDVSIRVGVALPFSPVAARPRRGISTRTPPRQAALSLVTRLRVSGPPCAPAVTPPSSYPVVLGDIPSTSSASATFTIDFGHCSCERAIYFANAVELGQV